MQVKIGITFHHAKITYFQMNGLYASSRFSKQIICGGIHFSENFKYEIDCLPKIG